MSEEIRPGRFQAPHPAKTETKSKDIKPSVPEKHVEAAAGAGHVSGKRVREGVVLSDKMQKTIIVEVTRLMEHSKFKKILRRKVKYAVHDEKNEAKSGDKVRIVETRPISKSKRWRLVKVLAK